MVLIADEGRTRTKDLARAFVVAAAATCLAASRGPAEAQDPRVAGRGSWIGIRVDVAPDTIEARLLRMAVIEVYRGGPAAIAGVRPGDTLVLAGPPASYEEWTRAVAAASPGDTIRLHLVRNGQGRTVSVRTDRRPPSVRAVPVDRYQRTRHRVFRVTDSLLLAAADALRTGVVHVDSLRMESVFEWADSAFRSLADAGGSVRIEQGLLPEFMTTAWRDAPVSSRTVVGEDVVARRSRMAGADLRDLTSALSGPFGVDEGVLAIRVAPRSPAARAGLIAGDVVVSVDGEPVRTISELLATLSRASWSVRVDVVRHRKRLSLPAPFP